MAESSKHCVSAYLLQLMNLYAHTGVKKEEISQALRKSKLLFKDWPNKKEKKIEINISQEETDQAKNDIVSAQENEESKLLQKALDNAEKTRRVFAKRQERENIRLNDHIGSNLSDTQQQAKASAVVQKPESVQPNCAKAHKLTSQTKTRLVSKEAVKRNVGSIAQSHLNNLINPKTKASLPSSTSTKAKYAPAHTKAPFKTAATRIPPNKTAAKPNSRPTSRPTSKTRVVKVQPAQTLQSGKFPHNLARESESREITTPSTPVDSVEELSTVLSEVRIDRDVEHREQIDVHQNSQKHVIDQAEASSFTQQSVKVDEAEKPVKFKLSRDGAKLSVPIKLSKAISNNRRLRQKLKKGSLIVPVSNKSSAADRFLQKFAVYNQASLGTDDHMLLTKLNVYTQTYTNLLKMLQNIGDINDSYSWKGIVRARRTIEFILQTFSTMEDEFYQVMKGAQRLKSNDITPEYNSGHQLQQPPHWWLPSSVVNAPRIPSGVMKYTGARQLLRYQDSLHQYQSLLLEKHFLDGFGSTIVASLHNIELGDRELGQLYRNLYSLLCTRDRQFPTLVEDNIDELENGDEEDPEAYDF